MVSLVSAQLPPTAGQTTPAARTEPPEDEAKHGTIAGSSSHTRSTRPTATTSSSNTFVQGGSQTTNLATERAQEQLELAQVRELAQRDREVKTHERTHAAIGGEHTTAPRYTYEKGPDGRLYAVEGEVRIDTSPVANDPQATLEKAEIIMRAALSVAEPSDADRRVAAQARVMAADARAELAKAEQVAEETAVEDDAEEEVQRSDDKTVDKTQTNEQQQARQHQTQQALQEFNERLQSINENVRRVNQRLIDAGVVHKLFPEGSIINKNS